MEATPIPHYQHVTHEQADNPARPAAIARYKALIHDTTSRVVREINSLRTRTLRNREIDEQTKGVIQDMGKSLRLANSIQSDADQSTLLGRISDSIGLNQWAANRLRELDRKYSIRIADVIQMLDKANRKLRTIRPR